MAIQGRVNVKRASPKTAEANRVPAPIKGIDSRTVLSEGDQEHCIYSFNIVPGEYGMKVRTGFREWAIELTLGAGTGIGTIIPLGGSDADNADDRLFAVTNEGIWDITTFDAPVIALDFLDPGNGGDTSPFAGKGVYTQYTTDAGEQLLFYADSKNGLFQYSELTDTWVRASGITGPVLSNVVFITSHKKQLWFIEEDSSKAWYLPIAAIAGVALEFFFGSKFKHGSNLGGLFSWTVDGGIGVDDYFVAVSRSGDVIPYQGNDPSSADDWNAVGQWFIGALPKGNRFATTHGGNLLILSSFGLIAMSDLLQGVDGKDVTEKTQSLKISAILNRRMRETRLLDGWDVKFMPSQGSIIVSEPKRINGTYEQAILNTTTDGWGFWREVPMTCFDEWSGKVYFGTEDDRIMVMDSALDNTLITPAPETTVNGTPIDFSILTTFQDFGSPAVFKRGKYVRSQYISKSTPVSTSKFRYDYNLDEFSNIGLHELGAEPIWDASSWDDAIWTSEIPSGQDKLAGSWGMGRTIAIATRGSTTSETTLVGWDVVWDVGAPI